MTHPVVVWAARSHPRSIYSKTPPGFAGRWSWTPRAEDSQADTIRPRGPCASGARQGHDVDSWFMSQRATRSVREVLVKWTS